MTDKIQIEVAYATPDKQLILSLHVAAGTTVYQAAELSGIVNEFPEIQLSEAKMGLFGKGVRNPQEEVLREMDRVEIYVQPQRRKKRLLIKKRRILPRKRLMTNRSRYSAADKRKGPIGPFLMFTN